MIIVHYLTLALRYVLTFNNILTVLLFLNLCAVKNLTDAAKEMKESTVYDIDLVRTTMLSDLQYAYSEGCRTGVDYPPEYREDQTGFNANSPTIWCGQKQEDLREWMLNQVFKAGRKPRQ